MGVSPSTDIDAGAGHPRPPLRLGLTSWTSVPTVGAVAGLIVEYCSGLILWWVNWLAATPLNCYVLIFAQDALHGAAHGSPRINRLVEWAGTAVFAIP